MKKTILIVSVIVLALLVVGVVGVDVAYAQSGQPPVGRGMTQGGGYGPMHDYVEKALANKLGLTEAQVEEQIAAGKSMYQIALDNGIAEADVPAFLTEVHTAAFDAAVADGVMTREQADWMSQRMQGRGYDDGTGACPMGGNSAGMRGGGGQGRMGRWNQ
ncbi:MAG: hypothetical protein HY869_05140 [Chloroflexi bacterium]|nr:hypothetical protein [Chloroflexota bacterium]